MEKHYVYKHSVMHFRDDGNHWYSLVKLTSTETVKSSNRTLIKPVVYWWFWRSCRKKAPGIIKKHWFHKHSVIHFLIFWTSSKKLYFKGRESYFGDADFTWKRSHGTLVKPAPFPLFWRHFRKSEPKIIKKALVFPLLGTWRSTEAENLIKPVENWSFWGSPSGHHLRWAVSL